AIGGPHAQAAPTLAERLPERGLADIEVAERERRDEDDTRTPQHGAGFLGPGRRFAMDEEVTGVREQKRCEVRDGEGREKEQERVDEDRFGAQVEERVAAAPTART